MSAVTHDKAFQELVTLISGDGANELIRKMEPGQSDLHGAAHVAHTSKKKREKTQARIGLASNIVGLGAGVGGTAAALRDPRMKKHKATRKIYRAGSKIPSPLSSKGGKAGAMLAGGALGLQLTNIAGDAVANRVLSRSAKKDPNVKGGTLTAVRVAGQQTKKTKDKITKRNLAPITSRGKLVPEPVSKSVEEVELTWTGEIAKANLDKQQLFGWASVIEVNGEPIIDLQGDRISADEMEKSAYEYVVKSRKGGDMHLRDEWEPIQKSEMIESFMVTPEKREAMGLPSSVPTGWWVGFQVNDPDVWSKVKSGERTGFSIHGRGRRETV